MRRVISFALPACLIAACHPFSENSGTDVPSQLKYELVSMTGHEDALERDKAVLGAANLKPTTLFIDTQSNGELTWDSIYLGTCVGYANSSDGVYEMLHRCIERVIRDGEEILYLPFLDASENFLDNIVPNIHTQQKTASGDLEWLNSKGDKIAHFKFLGTWP